MFFQLFPPEFSEILKLAICIVFIYGKWSSRLTFENYFPKISPDFREIFEPALVVLMVYGKWSSELTFENFVKQDG